MFHNYFVGISVLDWMLIEISIVANNTGDKMFRLHLFRLICMN